MCTSPTVCTQCVSGYIVQPGAATCATTCPVSYWNNAGELHFLTVVLIFVLQCAGVCAGAFDRLCERLIAFLLQPALQTVLPAPAVRCARLAIRPTSCKATLAQVRVCCCRSSSQSAQLAQAIATHALRQHNAQHVSEALRCSQAGAALSAVQARTGTTLVSCTSCLTIVLIFLLRCV